MRGVTCVRPASRVPRPPGHPEETEAQRGRAPGTHTEGRRGEHPTGPWWQRGPARPRTCFVRQDGPAPGAPGTRPRRGPCRPRVRGQPRPHVAGPARPPQSPPTVPTRSPAWGGSGLRAAPPPPPAQSRSRSPRSGSHAERRSPWPRLFWDSGPRVLSPWALLGGVPGAEPRGTCVGLRLPWGRPAPSVPARLGALGASLGEASP